MKAATTRAAATILPHTQVSNRNTSASKRRASCLTPNFKPPPSGSRSHYAFCPNFRITVLQLRSECAANRVVIMEYVPNPTANLARRRGDEGGLDMMDSPRISMTDFSRLRSPIHRSASDTIRAGRPALDHRRVPPARRRTARSRMVREPQQRALLRFDEVERVVI